MGRILITFASDYGRTERAAQAVASGAEQIQGIGISLLPVDQVGREQVLDADGLILGSPVHMGSVHWQMKRFIDETLSSLWVRDQFAHRVGGVFATGGGFGSAGSGCEFAMLSMLAVLAELGSLIVTMPRSTEGFADGGLHWGPYAKCGTSSGHRAPIPRRCLIPLQSHGANVARVVSVTKSERSRAEIGRAENTERNSA